MVIALEKQWIWDSWYAHDGARWHGFFLKADKSLINPDLRHFNVTCGHAVSDDLVQLASGTCSRPRPGPAGTTSPPTGSVVQDDAGAWHPFYTGTSKSDEGFYQRIGHATSTDLHSWVRVGDGLALDLTGPNASAYEVEHMRGFWHDRAMRDPRVMLRPRRRRLADVFHRPRPGHRREANEGGAIGFATSPDLGWFRRCNRRSSSAASASSKRRRCSRRADGGTACSAPAALVARAGRGGGRRARDRNPHVCPTPARAVPSVDPAEAARWRSLAGAMRRGSPRPTTHEDPGFPRHRR
ncbi:MAG: hypothetical protein R3D59_12310 [Paracoccaceae bacterium]